MQQVLLFSSTIFCFLHSYRDWLHSKKVFDTWLTKYFHFWDWPQYEIHGAVLYFVGGCVLLFFSVT